MTNLQNNGSGQILKFFDNLKRWIDDLLGSKWLRDGLGVIPGASAILTLIERGNKLTEWRKSHPLNFEDSLSVLWRGLVLGDLPGDERELPQLKDLQENPSQFIGDLLSFGFTDPAVREVFESVGAAIYDSSVAAILGKQLPRGSEAIDRARAFVGFVTALGAAPQALAAATEVGSLGQIDKLGDNIAQVYFNLGLGFLTWQTMAPILQAGILDPLTEDVQLQYRGKRFTRSEVQDLFALGKITRADLENQLAKLGYRDEDIQQVIALAYNNLSRGDVIDLWHAGIFDSPEVARRLRGLGYSPDDVDLILRLEVKQDVKDDRTESVSVLTRSFKEGLLPEADFRAILSGERYTDREIDLRIQIVRLEQENDRRKLSLGQLKSAWQENIILDPEVLFRLRGLDYADSEASLILDTWKAELAPDFVRVNQSTILELYRFGIFDRRVTLERLGEVGYNPEDASALVSLTEARFPEAFGAAPPRKQRLLSLGAVTDLFAMGRLNDDDLRKWAETTGFKDKDVENMIDLIKSKAVPGGRVLSQSTIEDAYITGIFTRAVAVNTLQQVGFSPADSETIIKTVEAQNPVVFAPETVTSVRQPTISALVTAVQAGFITEAEFYQKAVEIGYNREGATLYLETSRAKLVKGTKSLTKADILEFYRKNLMGYSEALNSLEDQGYSERDADLLLRSEQKGVQATDIWKAMLAGLIDPQAAFTALIGLGFTKEQIDAALEELNA